MSSPLLLPLPLWLPLLALLSPLLLPLPLRLPMLALLLPQLLCYSLLLPQGLKQGFKAGREPLDLHFKLGVHCCLCLHVGAGQGVQVGQERGK